MSQSKREQVVSHLRYIRQELREMHQGVMEDGLLPEAGEVRGVMAQMEALLEFSKAKRPEKRRLSPNNFQRKPLSKPSALALLRQSPSPGPGLPRVFY